MSRQAWPHSAQAQAVDKVVATNEQTGETQVGTVMAEIKGEGLKHLVKLTVDTDGPAGSATSEITATEGHPFWVPFIRKWVDASDLKPGQWLRTSAGTYVQIGDCKSFGVTPDQGRCTDDQ